MVHRHAGHPQEAAAVFGKAIAPHPEDVVDDCVNRGNAYDDVGDFERPMADCAHGTSYERHDRMDDAKKESIVVYRRGLRSPGLFERLRVHGIAIEVG